MTDKLPAKERVKILSGRLANLKAGSGDFDPPNRARAIYACADGLLQAQADLAAMERK